ncbi:MAG TPA: NTP transferase domain-containing protein [Candidatus Aminicenantes bacterium]|nr:NTP transferase domain-containing protein [Candidatus Aminicenantes bacterium]
MPPTCLILAAGAGSRLATCTDCKPLLPLQGQPLIDRVMQNMMTAGVDDFLVITGHQADKLRAHLEGFARVHQVTVRTLHNEQWQRANGISVWVARSTLTAPFLLTMADHLVDPEIIRRLVRQGLGAGTVRLAIDRPATAPWVDVEDVTKVTEEDGIITAIGKQIAGWNAYDTGVFLCHPDLFAALAASSAEGDDSLSGGISWLARQRQALVCDISGHFWLDVDDENAMNKALRWLKQEKDNENGGI